MALSIFNWQKYFISWTLNLSTNSHYIPCLFLTCICKQLMNMHVIFFFLFQIVSIINVAVNALKEYTTHRPAFHNISEDRVALFSRPWPPPSTHISRLPRLVLSLDQLGRNLQHRCQWASRLTFSGAPMTGLRRKCCTDEPVLLWAHKQHITCWG